MKLIFTFENTSVECWENYPSSQRKSLELLRHWDNFPNTEIRYMLQESVKLLYIYVIKLIHDVETFYGSKIFILRY